MNLKTILMGILLFIGLAILFDLYFYLIYKINPYANAGNSIFYEQHASNKFLSRTSSIDLSLLFYSLLNGFYKIDLSLLLYSALNGFYEEMFFLGICLNVVPCNRKYYFVYSIILRYSFHTYQGNISAIAIGLFIGGIYYFLYTRMKEKNLFPFILAHSITDVFGAGIIGYFF